MRFLGHVATLFLLSSFGCADDLTQLVVVIDTDLAVPTEVDRIDLVVDGPTANSVDGSMALDRAGILPLTLGLTPAGGTLGPVTVTARAMREGTRVLERRVRARFVRGRTLMLRVSLLRACSSGTTVCTGPDETCLDDGTCGGIDVEADDLPAWTGRPPRLPESPSGMDASTDATLDIGMADVVSPPDAGTDMGPTACPPGVCDPALQTGCSGGQACDLFTTGEPICRPTGAGGDGAPCANGLDCTLGYGCVGVEGGGECRRLCCSGDDSLCAAGQRCNVSLGAPGSQYQACFPSGCDPVEQTGCSAAEACYPRDDMGATTCIPPDGTGMQFAACDGSLNHCARGFICVGTICLKMCRVGGGEPSCPDGTTCIVFPGFTTFGRCDS